MLKTTLESRETVKAETGQGNVCKGKVSPISHSDSLDSAKTSRAAFSDRLTAAL